MLPVEAPDHRDQRGRRAKATPVLTVPRRFALYLSGTFLLGALYHLGTSDGPSWWYVGGSFAVAMGVVSALFFWVPNALQRRVVRRRLLGDGWHPVLAPGAFADALQRLPVLVGPPDAYARPGPRQTLLLTGYQNSPFWKSSTHPSYIVAMPYRPASSAWVAGGSRSHGPGAKGRDARQRTGVHVLWTAPGGWMDVPDWTSRLIVEASRARPSTLPREPVLVVGGGGWIGVDLRTYGAPEEGTLAWIGNVAQMLERLAAPGPASGPGGRTDPEAS